MSKCRYNLSEDCHNKDCLACVLDKIRTEIEKKYARAKQMSSVLQMNAYTDCLQIIDKYKGENEQVGNHDRLGGEEI